MELEKSTKKHKISRMNLRGSFHYKTQKYNKNSFAPDIVFRTLYLWKV